MCRNPSVWSRVSGGWRPSRKQKRKKGSRSSRTQSQRCGPSSASWPTCIRSGLPRAAVTLLSRQVSHSRLISLQSIVQHFLVLLMTSSDESLRFLSFRLDFTEHYRCAFQNSLQTKPAVSCLSLAKNTVIFPGSNPCFCSAKLCPEILKKKKTNLITHYVMI